MKWNDQGIVLKDLFNIDAVSLLIKSTGQNELLPRAMRVNSEKKADGSWLTEADTIAHEILTNSLQEISGFPVLSEEASIEEQNKLMQSEDIWWCVDPLDGSSNFAAGIPYYAISVALVVKGDVEFAAVYDSSADEFFAAVRGQGASLNGRSLDCRQYQRPLADAIGLIDFKRLPETLASALAAKPAWASQRSFGASALDWCQLAAGRCHIYLHGKQMPWDYAAGKLILTEAGGIGSDWQGEPPVVKNNQSVRVLATVSEYSYRECLTFLSRLDNNNFTNTEPLSAAV